MFYIFKLLLLLIKVKLKQSEWYWLKHRRRHRDFDSTFNNGRHKSIYNNDVATKRNSQCAIVCMVSSRNNTDITFLLNFKKRKEKNEIRKINKRKWKVYENDGTERVIKAVIHNEHTVVLERLHKKKQTKMNNC